jgi:hypothetical protein
MLPQGAAPREMKVATKYDWPRSHRSVAAIGKVNLPARRGRTSPYGTYGKYGNGVSNLLVSSGIITGQFTVAALQLLVSNTRPCCL